MTTSDPGFLRVPEVARRANVHVRDVYAAIEAGVLPGFRDADGLVVVPADAVGDLTDHGQPA